MALCASPPASGAGLSGAGFVRTATHCAPSVEWGHFARLKAETLPGAQAKQVIAPGGVSHRKLMAGC